MDRVCDDDEWQFVGVLEPLGRDVGDVLTQGRSSPLDDHQESAGYR